MAAVAAAVGGGASDSARPMSEAMRFVTGPPPLSRASGAGPSNLAFVSRRVGFAATTGGLRFVGRIGWARPVDRGRIERTDDGGASWRTLWSANQVSFEAISVAGRTIVATGFIPRRNLRRVGYDPHASRLLVASDDGGRTWRRLQSPGGGRVQILTRRTWILAAPQPWEQYPERPAIFYRTNDAGGHWRRFHLPARPSAVRFITSRDGFVGGRQRTCPSGHQLWRTRDGGLTWRPIGGTCGPPLVALDTVSARVLIAAQGSSGFLNGDWSSIVRLSTDGGTSWRTLWRQRNRRVIALAFTDGRRGFVVDERWRSGASGGCSFYRLRTTDDGGRTWSPRSLPLSTSVCASGGTGGGPAIPTAFHGTRHAWAGDEGAGVVWRTSDGGRTWRVSGEPRTLGYTILTGFSMALTDSGLVVGTAAGPAVTRDDGRTWRLIRSPSRRKMEIADRRRRFRGPAYVRLASGRWYGTDTCTRTWRPTNRDIWLECATGKWNLLGLVLLTSHDGGQSWRLLRTRTKYITEFAAVGAREAWAYSQPYSYEDYSSRGVPRKLWHTTDGGATWQRVSVALPPTTQAAWVTTG